MFRKRSLLLSLVGIALWSCPLIGQKNQQQPAQGDSSYQLKLQSNLVLVRVVVRDAKGDPIRGLTKEDFRLLDQGKEQSITQFDEEPGTNPSATPVAAAASAGSASAAAPPVSGPRFIALYFDDLNSSDADLMQARDAAEQYLATSLQPNDRVAIFTAEKILSNFTADPRQIQQALAQLHASTRGPAREHPCPDLTDYQANEILHTNDLDGEAWRVAISEAEACPVKIFAGSSNLDPRKPDGGLMQPIRMLAERIVDQAQNLTRANLAQFEQVVKFIAQAPGQRTIVLVSPGFLSESEQYPLDRIIDRALREQVVINSLDPKGLAVLMRESDASRNTIVLPDPRASEARHHLDAAKEFAGADVLAEMADGTGGEFFHNDNDLKSGFAALAGDPPHYILAFSPKKVKWDGKFHALKISLVTKVKGSTIQARRGYFAVRSDAETPELATPGKSATPPAIAPPTNKSNLASSSGPEPPTNPSRAPEVASAAPDVPAAPASKPAEVNGSSNLSEAETAPNIQANLKPIHLHHGINRFNVEQFTQFIASARGKSDTELEKQLLNIELTQRVDSITLAKLEATLPGTQSRQMLIARADSAAFLMPPAAATALPAAPTAEDQLQWLKAATDFATNTLRKLPNFFATRDVTRFADNPAKQVMGTYRSYQPLHEVDRMQATVLYRDGKQIVDSEKGAHGSGSSAPGLVTEGEFGPVLGTVLTDASKTSLTWSRWEPGRTGPAAVYRFAVPRNKSHYEVAYCCVNGIGLYKVISAYHGEIAIDPASGSVVRIAIQADLKDSYPLVRSDLLVEYGSVDIGGKSYICPVHSVAIVKAYTEALDMTQQLPQLVGSTGPVGMRYGVVQTMINDIRFKDYHVFRSDSRIVPTAE